MSTHPNEQHNQADRDNPADRPQTPEERLEQKRQVDAGADDKRAPQHRTDYVEPKSQQEGQPRRAASEHGKAEDDHDKPKAEPGKPRAHTARAKQHVKRAKVRKHK
jgi:hypothetical protein